MEKYFSHRYNSNFICYALEKSKQTKLYNKCFINYKFLEAGATYIVAQTKHRWHCLKQGLNAPLTFIL